MEHRVKLIGLMCPQCGGSLSFKEGARIINCQYCNSSLLLRFKEGILKYYLPAAITRKMAASKVRQLFENKEAAVELRYDAVLRDLTLYYIPYWRFKSAIFGHVEGVEETYSDFSQIALSHSDQDDFKSHYIRSTFEPKKRREVIKRIKNIMIINISASNMSDIGIPNLSSVRQRSSGMEIYKRLDQFPKVGLLQKGGIRNATVIDQMYSRNLADAEAEKIIRQYMDTRSSGLISWEADIRELSRRKFLLYYPIWVCRFKFRGRFYRAIIDGLKGKAISAILPRQQKGRSLGLLSTSFLLGLVISGLARSLFFGGNLAKLLLRFPLTWFIIFIAFVLLIWLARIALNVFYTEKDLTLEG